VLCRAQLLLARGRGPPIAQHVGCDDRTMREVIRAFGATGLAGLARCSRRPHPTHPAFSATSRERLEALLHRSLRAFGWASSLWTLEPVAEVSFAEALAATPVSALRAAALVL
jgi:hypothetical protein